MPHLAPAKINLHLRVGPPMPNGFHPLLTWMVTVGLYDTLEFSLLPQSERPSTFRVRSNDPGIPCDQRNLIAQAVLQTSELQLTTSPTPSLTIHLQKRIPTGGGLGGGSSDAACTLTAINRLLDLRLDAATLRRVAGRLGSDLTFFLSGPSAICTGKGDDVRPIPPPLARWAVLMLPPFGVPTGLVYERFDRLHLGNQDHIQAGTRFDQWTLLPADELLPLLINDLEKPAFDLFPELESLRDECGRHLGRTVRMSGSGSTLFTLFDQQPQAEQAVDRLKDLVSATAVEIAPSTAPRG